ncbi:MAG: YicC/YloC family endoribonuclease [Castellaniella sp.]|uniref:YicC/YloC family endoribonuclease n=1 Tax=Castellaniella sp. TaxID=1955812 RepID=UPI002A363C63|nr:YicC/YloC family endoribonuclease [Castellaniella sp.]MDY0309842.1 YicC/YloC family endoribonuclease [Castellaniella sp.]
MIRSMTAFGTARLDSDAGSVSAEIRSVNNRYLDLSLRIPEDLRFSEARIRDLIGRQVLRGKVELKLSYAALEREALQPIDAEAVRALAEQLQWARRLIPDLPAPTLAELPRTGTMRGGLDAEIWLPLCEQACEQALAQFSAARQREGKRLAQAMLALADEIDRIVTQVEAELPDLVRQHQDRVAQRLREALEAASPDGFAAIGGAELSARIAQEASLFGLRVDVAEELTRLRSHQQELREILSGRHASSARGGSGKRLDFLFQEMNREANTLGSKAAALSVTQAAIDLKLLIEQMREQAQNIE